MFMYMAEWKKKVLRIVGLTLLVLGIVLAILLAIYHGVIRNPTRLRTIALNEVMEQIQLEIDSGISAENGIKIVYEKDIKAVNGVEYYLNDNEDKKAVLNALCHSSYIYDVRAYQPAPYFEDMYISDYRIGITYFPDVFVNGFYYQIDNSDYDVIKNIFPEINDYGQLEKHMLSSATSH